jgi:hypothetical protein
MNRNRPGLKKKAPAFPCPCEIGGTNQYEI